MNFKGAIMQKRAKNAHIAENTTKSTSVVNKGI